MSRMVCLPQQSACEPLHCAQNGLSCGVADKLASHPGDPRGADHCRTANLPSLIPPVSRATGRRLSSGLSTPALLPPLRRVEAAALNSKQFASLAPQQSPLPLP